jgi:basic amino acid/polyamine antiporter, APA family
MEAELRKSLSLFDLTMIAIGASIGSGIFLTLSSIAKELPSPLWILGAWALGGAFTLAGALTFAELGALLPRAGGVNVFLAHGFGELVAFLHGWVSFLVITTGSIAALAVAFARYLAYLVPVLAPAQTSLALLVVAVVAVVNVVGVRPGALFVDAFTVVKLVALAGLVLVGILLGTSKTTDFAAPLHDARGSVLAAAMVGVLWSYGGWQHATFTGGEARSGDRDLPRALILGTGVVTVVYLLANLAYMFLLPPASIAASEQAASDAVSVVLGRSGGALIALVIVLSVLGTASVYMMTGPRVYFAMAERGVLFRALAYVSPRYHTPVWAIAAQAVWAAVLVLFWGTFDRLIAYVVFTDWVFFGLTGACVFRLRRTMPNVERPHKVVGYPYTPLAFLAGCVWFVGNTVVTRPKEALAGLGLLGLGIPVYLVRSLRGRRR